MSRLSYLCYAGGLGIGLILALLSSFWPVVILGLLGAVISWFYTAPPVRLVHRGLGEIAVFLGFGPIMTLGAYYVQAKSWSWEALYASVPVGLLVAMILYVNEIPDRAGDGAAGKRTLPVRLRREIVIQGFVFTAVLAFALILLGVLIGVLPVPCILALAAFPLVSKVSHGLRHHYDSPYELMPFMGTNIKLHSAVGGLLILGYIIAVIGGHAMTHPPFFLR